MKRSLADRLYGLSLWLALLGPLGRENTVSDDLWGKLAIPAVWRATGAFPYVDRFSYTAWGAPWIDHEWLSGVVFYGLLSGGGDSALSLLKAAMVCLMIAGAFWSARLHRLPVLWPAGILLAGLPVLFRGLSATGRPQLFTFCLFPVLLAFLEDVRLSGRSRRLWVVPAAGVVWANLHGGFVAGLGMVSCYAAGELLRGKPWKPYLLAAAAWVAATTINPYGLGYWRYLWYALSLRRLEITEWSPILLAGPVEWPMKLAIASTAAVLIMAWERCRRDRRSWREMPWPHILALLTCFWEGFRAVKLSPLAVLCQACCVPPLLAWSMPGTLEEDRPRAASELPALAAAAAALWALGCWYDMVPRWGPLQVQVRDNGYPMDLRSGNWVQPVEAVRYLERSGGCGTLWTPFRVGEFVFWRLYPRFRVSLDGRMECVYPKDMLTPGFRDHWLGRMTGPALEQADWALVDRFYASRYASFRDSPEWKTVYEDGTYGVFRRAGVPGGLPADHEEARRYQAPAGSSPVSAFFRPDRDGERFRRYALEASAGSPRAAACGSR